MVEWWVGNFIVGYEIVEEVIFCEEIFGYKWGGVDEVVDLFEVGLDVVEVFVI